MFFCQDLKKANEELEVRVQARTLELEKTIRKLEKEIIQRKKLSQENRYLNQQIRQELHFGSMIGKSTAFQKVLEQVKLVAHTNSTVLVQGESGTGKELIARAIHENSDRKDSPMVKVNCASIPRELFESEFFGHVKGSFTGALADRVGRFELANGGTLFLDEIGEIPLPLQSKFLRVLQEGQLERVGATQTQDINVRIVAPLRERKEDIIPLVQHFMEVLSKEMSIPCPSLSKEQRRKLKNYSWPGNIRELKNILERALILSSGNQIDFTLEPENIHLPQKNEYPVSNDNTTRQEEINSLHELKLLEKQIILKALEICQGKIYGTKGAAEYLEIPATTLASKMKN